MMCPVPASETKVHAGLGSQVSSAVRAMWTRRTLDFAGGKGGAGSTRLLQTPTVYSRKAIRWARFASPRWKTRHLTERPQLLLSVRET